MEILKKVPKKAVFMLLVFAVFIAAAVFLFSSKPKTAEAAGSLNFTLINNNTEYEVSGNSNSGEVVIPASYNEKPVTRIANFAFSNCSGLTSITIPDSVTSIGSYAFSNCSGLTSITIPNGVTSIGNEAFRYCDKLASITIPVSVTSIGSHAFSGTAIWDNAENNGVVYADKWAVGYKGIISDVSLKTNTMGIAARTFYDCLSLTSITIPYSVKSIGDGAFFYCSRLTSITISNGVTIIGNDAFRECASLASITIPDSVTSIGDYAFSGTAIGRYAENDSVIYADKWAIGYKGTINDVSLKADTVGVASSAFSKCRKLTSITIPNSVKSIGNDAFKDCSGLESITVGIGNLAYKSDGSNCIIRKSDNVLISGCKNSIVPGYVKRIANNAFNGCSGLKSITIPNSVVSIGEGAFYNCKGLTNVTIPGSVASIGASAFFYCSGLTSIIIGNNVTSIGEGAFSYCSGLTSITIPGSVTSIGASVFSYCSGLTSITVGNSVTNIKENAFKECIGLTSITIPSSVTSIGASAFYNCSGLTSITIGNSVTSIGDYAFQGCSITSIIIPDSVISIGAAAFYNCSGLTSITIPDSVISIGMSAFASCSSLTSITIPDSVESIGDSVFYDCSGLTSIIIPNSVINIGSYAFYSCSSLASITIPDSVTSIGDNVFKETYIWNNAENNSVVYADRWAVGYKGNISNESLRTDTAGIANLAFIRCSELTSIIIPNGVINIGAGAFSFCSGLTSIEIPNSVTTIGADAFSFCGNLTNIEISNSVISIGQRAFFGCVSLTSIIIPDSVISIGNSAFSSCFNLTSLEISNNVISIEDHAFSNCYGLTSITIPDSVTSIGEGAFLDCNNLSSVYLATSNLVNSNAFEGTKSNLKIYLSSLNYNYYVNAPDWKSYKDKFVAVENTIKINDRTYANEVYYYNTNQYIEITSGTPIASILLNGDSYPYVFEVTEEGEYNLEIKDIVGNIKTYHFIIDKKPRIRYNGGKYFTNKNNNIWLNVIDLTLEIENCDNPTVTLNGDLVTTVNNLLSVSKEGKYTINIIGNDGVDVTYTFYIDKELPKVEISRGSNTAKLEESAKISGNASLIFFDNGDSYTSSYKRGQNIAEIILRDNSSDEKITINPLEQYPLPLKSGDYTLIIIDRAGNLTTINFFIYGKPQIDGAENGKSYTSDITLIFQDALGGNELKTVNINGMGYNITNFDIIENRYTIIFTGLGKYVISLIDNFGNQTEITFTIVSETTLPFEEQLYTVTFVSEVPDSIVNGGIANTSIIINKKYPSEYLNIELKKDGAVIVYVFGSEIKEDGKYIATITNNEGYRAVFEFTIITKVRNGFKYICPEGFEIEFYLINGIQQNVESLPSKTEIDLKTDGVHDITIWNPDTGERYRYVVRIDTVPPVLVFDRVNFDDKTLELRVVNNSVKLLSSEKKLSSLTVTLNGVEMEADIGTMFRQNGTYKLIAIDEVGNINTYEFVIEKKLDILAFSLSSLGVVLVVTLFCIIGHFRRKKQSIKAMM